MNSRFCIYATCCWLLLITVLSVNDAICQSKSGMYLTMDIDLELCENKVKLLNTEQAYCLSQEPIIELDLIEYIDSLVYDSTFQMKRFRMILTLKGADYVTTVAKKLPSHQLGLIVSGILVSVIELEGIYSARSIIIWDQNDSDAMEWIHRSLVNKVNKNYKKS